jgi:WD40 repeat protein
MNIARYLFLGALVIGAPAVRSQPTPPALTNSNTAKAAGILAYNSNGKFVAIAGTDHVIRVYKVRTVDPSSVELTQTLTGNAGAVLTLGFIGDNSLVSFCADQTTRIWDITSGKILLSTKGASGNESMAAISWAGAPVVASAARRHVSLCNYRTGESLHTFEVNDSDVAALAFTPDGKSLVIGSYKGVVRVLDVASWKVTSSIDLDTPVHAMAASARYVAVGYRDGAVALLGAKDLISVSEVKAHRGTITVLAFSPDGKRLASAAADQAVKIWDVETHKVIRTFECPANARSAVFSPDGRELAVCGADGAVSFWRVP